MSPHYVQGPGPGSVAHTSTRERLCPQGASGRTEKYNTGLKKPAAPLWTSYKNLGVLILALNNAGEASLHFTLMLFGHMMHEVSPNISNDLFPCFNPAIVCVMFQGRS